MIEQNEHLQSQYNSSILKSSQMSHLKAELAQKCEQLSQEKHQL